MRKAVKEVTAREEANVNTPANANGGENLPNLAFSEFNRKCIPNYQEIALKQDSVSSGPARRV